MVLVWISWKWEGRLCAGVNFCFLRSLSHFPPKLLNHLHLVSEKPPFQSDTRHARNVTAQKRIQPPFIEEEDYILFRSPYAEFALFFSECYLGQAKALPKALLRSVTMHAPLSLPTNTIYEARRRAFSACFQPPSQASKGCLHYYSIVEASAAPFSISFFLMWGNLKLKQAKTRLSPTILLFSSFFFPPRKQQKLKDGPKKPLLEQQIRGATGTLT